MSLKTQTLPDSRNNVCSVCFSERKLQELDDLLEIFMLLSIDTPVDYSSIKLCWECLATLKKVAIFKNKIKTAFSLRLNNKNFVGSLSSLSFIINIDFDITLLHANTNLSFKTEVIENDDYLSSEVEEVSLTSEINEPNVTNPINSPAKKNYRTLVTKNVSSSAATTLEPVFKKLKIIKTESLCHNETTPVKNKLTKFTIKKGNELKKLPVFEKINTDFTEPSSVRINKVDPIAITSKPTIFIESGLIKLEPMPINIEPVQTAAEKATHTKEPIKLESSLMKETVEDQTKKRLNAHKYKDHAERCTYDHCGKSCKNKNPVITKIRVTRPPPDYTNTKHFECDICQKKVKFRGSFISHLISTHGARPRKTRREPDTMFDDLDIPPDFRCVMCDVTCKTKTLYLCHMRYAKRHVSQDVLDKNRCKICGKGFKSPKFLKKHVNSSHLHVYEAQCSLCGKDFIHKKSMIRHMRSAHEGFVPEKNKVCDICGHACSTRTQLKTHARRHTGEKPYGCPECGTCFRQNSSYRTHYKLVHLKIGKNEKTDKIPAHLTISNSNA